MRIVDNMEVESDVFKENGASCPSEAGLKIPERMIKREQDRLEDVERKKEAKKSQSVPEEKSGFFTAAFSSERAAIEELLVGCSGETDRTLATQTLEEVTTRTQQLQKFLNDSMVFLPQYVLSRAQASLQKLQNSLAEKRDEILPKKRFAFRSRATNTPKAGPPSADPVSVITSKDSAETAVDAGISPPEQCGFSHFESQVLTKSGEEIKQQDVLLTHLTNCKVRLLGSPSTVHIKHIQNCEIFSGPVSSSVFVDHCTGSTLSFPCQQLRTHHTTNTQVYLHVTSRAIIEDCKEVRFAPLTWTYPGLDEDFKVSGLDRKRNNWNQVDDFNWLAVGTQSPNWSVIPEAERRTEWD
ncbi:tubulin-specific chaperone C [Esox lucius]|uniref:Tubulin-specific chaperone C n=1 Tax=Esox lucius TaxID=8010 RepID=C1BYH4_ESOLU|nr:tubulin-specific chaperone C [Esox lucius]ACO14077.1 Tubulin-specific chaperone C [Esox lucius]